MMFELGCMVAVMKNDAPNGSPQTDGPQTDGSQDDPGQPSGTAVTAAAARAAHLIVDGSPVIFADTLAAALLGDSAEEFIGYHRLHGTHPVLAGARDRSVSRRSVSRRSAGCRSVRHSS